MHRWVVLAVGLLLGPFAVASTGSASADPSTSVAPEASMTSRPFKKGPVDLVEEHVGQKSEEQKAQEERLKAIEAAEAQKKARVVFLQYPQTNTDYTNEVVQRNVKVRIARPDAKFVPEIDLYQAGRREPDRTLRPGDQRAAVPDTSIDVVLQAVEEVSTIPWSALSDQDWQLKAHELRELSKEIWFVDRPDLREPLFLLYSQIGQSAENSNQHAPPFFMDIGGRAVNYYWYLAGVLANEEPGLMSKLTDRDMHGSINYYKDALDSGQYPTVNVSFEKEGLWDARRFAGEYQVYINGIERTITSRDGTYPLKPGRTDIYLARVDGGHSLSESVTLERIDDRIYFVRNVAQRLMGKDFIDQLMLHPNECSPELNADIVTYLAIYAKLHPQADIYIGLAKGGSVASRNIYLWRWDRSSSTLQRVLDDTGGFPVRFVGLVGSGLIFSGAQTMPMDPEQILRNSQSSSPPDDPTAGLATAKQEFNKDAMLEPEISGIPITYQLRGHYGRLMVVTGIDFAANLKGQWQDLYQTDDYALENVTEVTIDIEPCDDFSNPDACTITTDVPTDILRRRDWQRLVYLGVGVVLGKNAAIGYGPRGWIRTGWYNAPHAIDLTGHIGHAMLPPFFKNPSGRVRPILDLDFYAGMMLPFKNSLNHTPGTMVGSPMFTAGTAVTGGITF